MAVKPTYQLQARIDQETEERRLRLLKRLQCSTPELVRRAFRVLDELSLKAADQAAE